MIGRTNARHAALRALIIKRMEKEYLNPQDFDPVYKTDINYPDVHGYSLLHYAVEQSDMPYIKRLVAAGADCNFTWTRGPGSPMRLALKKGDMSVIQYLYQLGVNCSDLDSSLCGNEETKIWFQLELKKILKHPGKKSGNFTQFIRDTSTQLSRAVEIADIKFIKKCGLDAESNDIDNSELLLMAAKFGNVSTLQFLQSLGLKESTNHCDTLLTIAIAYQQFAMIEFLFSQKYDFDIPDQNHNSPIMIAVLHQLPDIVDKLAKAGADLTMTNRAGETILHCLAKSRKAETMSSLVTHPSLKALIHKKDIYGFTALDRAIERKNDHMITALLPSDSSLEKIRNSDRYGKIVVRIDQASVIAKMHYFLKSQYRDLMLFVPERGKCNGLTFLQHMYASQGREVWYFATLALLSKWDGREETLLTDFEAETSQKKYYRNLKEVFEQWINDVIWFQNTYHNRTHQLNFVKHNDNDYYRLLYMTGSTADRTYAQTRELWRYFSRMPEGVGLYVSSNRHIVSGTRKQNNTINFYDSNITYKTAFFHKKKAGMELMENYIFRGRDKKEIRSRMQLGYFSHNGQQPDFDYEIFREKEYPADAESAYTFQKNSPNKYTHLHIAILTRSLSSLIRLLSEGNCNVNAVDDKNQSALRLAVKFEYTAGFRKLFPYCKEEFLMEIFPGKLANARDKDSQTDFPEHTRKSLGYGKD